MSYVIASRFAVALRRPLFVAFLTSLLHGAIIQTQPASAKVTTKNSFHFFDQGASRVDISVRFYEPPWSSKPFFRIHLNYWKRDILWSQTDRVTLTSLQPEYLATLDDRPGSEFLRHQLHRLCKTAAAESKGDDVVSAVLFELQDGLPFKLKSGVSLEMDVHRQIVVLAELYRSKSDGHVFTVTSGRRTPAEQAASMVGKLDSGSDLSIYSNQSAAQEIRAAYLKAKAQGVEPTDVIKEIKAIITRQVKKNVFVSRHLREKAVDIRSTDMNAKQQDAFEKAAESKGWTVIKESKPPHFHIH